VRIVEINIPLRVPTQPDKWITVPPQGYGGIQSALASLVDGFAALGHEVALLGAPESSPFSSQVEVIEAADFKDVSRWVESANFDVVHDHSCSRCVCYTAGAEDRVWLVYHLSRPPDQAFAAHPNIVTLSDAHRRNTGLTSSHMIRLPVNPERFDFIQCKKSYLLFLGRVSPWKGVREAARFASCADMKLVVAGPRWEHDYYEQLINDYGNVVEYVGEVGGTQKRTLLAEAFATLAFSQPLPDQSGHVFCEPGSTIVSESAVSGTPVISSSNGCLPEIVPGIGAVLEDTNNITREIAVRTLESLPNGSTVRQVAIERWNHIKIAQDYLNLPGS
jgi:glycosyltransferase involved in cell wall biosynthesis